VVDTSGVFDDFALTALDRTDILVLVGTLDIPALKGLKLATQTLDLLNFPREKWRFVLNRADAKVGLSSDEYESTLGLKADCTLVSSREVLAAVNRGEPLVKAYSGHANSKAIKAFSHSIAGAARAAEADVEQDDKSRSSAGRFRLRKA
jgi:pilus assembly protein CpaE